MAGLRPASQITNHKPDPKGAVLASTTIMSTSCSYHDLNGSALISLQLYDYIVETELKNKSLVEVLGTYMEQKKTIPLYVAYPQTSHVHINVRRFIDNVRRFIDFIL